MIESISAIKNNTRRYVQELMIKSRTAQMKKAVTISRELQTDQQSKLMDMRELLGRAATRHDCKLNFVPAENGGVNLQVLNPRITYDFRTPRTIQPNDIFNGLNQESHTNSYLTDENAGTTLIDLNAPKKDFMENIKNTIKTIKEKNKEIWGKPKFIE